MARLFRSSRSLATVLLSLTTALGCADSASSSSSGTPWVDAGGPPTTGGGGSDGGGDGGGSSGNPPGTVVPGPQQGLYVIDYAGPLFHLSLEDGSVLGKHGGSGSGTNQYALPTGIAATKKHLYIADTGNRRLVRLTSASGAGWKTLDLGANAEPHGVGALLESDDAEDTVVFSDFAAMQFFTAPTSFEGTPTPGAKLEYSACNVALRAGEAAATAGCTGGPALKVVVSPYDGARVYPPDANTSELERPVDVAYLPDGTLVIADIGSFRVLCAKGPSQGDFGKQGDAGDLDFLSVVAITTDARGRIFVADTLRKRIVCVDDCHGANPKVFDASAISSMTGLAAVGPYP